jgi:ClpP class serine protease
MELGQAQGYLPLVHQLQAGNFEAAGSFFKNKKKENAPYAVALSLEPGAKVHKTDKYSSFDEAPQGSVAVIPVVGPMMQQDFCGSLGTQTLGRLTEEADAHPNIVGHVFVFDTPGGTVAGTERFSNIITGTQKPAVGYVQGMICSAGVWAGCGLNHIVMGGQTTQMGSIGTMLQYMDSSKADKKRGFVQKMVRADASYDKNEAFVQLLAGNDQPIKDQMLNPINEVFLNAVRTNRAGKLPTGEGAENVLSGKVYLAADAVKHGLADSIGSFQDAVQLALKLASDPEKPAPPSNSPKSNSTMTLKEKWGALLALAGIKSEAAASTPLTEANLEALNTKAQEQADQLLAANELVATLTTERDGEREKIKAKETELATATENLTKATTDLTAATTDLTKANDRVTALEAQVKTLGAQPGAMPTQPLDPNAQDKLTPPVAKPVVDPNAAHNKYAAQFFGK